MVPQWEEIERCIRGNGDLVIEPNFPDAFAQILTHIASWRLLVESWVQSDMEVCQRPAELKLTQHPPQLVCFCTDWAVDLRLVHGSDGTASKAEAKARAAAEELARLKAAAEQQGEGGFDENELEHDDDGLFPHDRILDGDLRGGGRSGARESREATSMRRLHSHPSSRSARGRDMVGDALP